MEMLLGNCPGEISANMEFFGCFFFFFFFVEDFPRWKFSMGIYILSELQVNFKEEDNKYLFDNKKKISGLKIIQEKLFSLKDLLLNHPFNLFLIY